MADISKITLPSNDEYNIKDATARDGLALKQDTLVSGTNIKTINNESLLGSGNITIQGGGDSLPDQTGHSGDILTTNGTAASWMDVSEASSVSIDTSISSSSTDNTIPSSKAVWDALSNVDALPDQTGHSGDFLTTNGTIASWADLPEETFLAEYNVTTFDEIKAAYDAGKYIFLKYLTLKEAHDVDVQWSLCPLTQYYYQELTSPNYKGEAYFLIPMNNGPPTPSLSYKYAWITINTAQQTGGWEVSSSSINLGRVVNSITTTAGAHTTITAQKGDVSFNVPTQASHVGAIAAPSSPSTGNILAYNGSSWIPSTESDPVFTASAAYGISSSDISNWNAKGTYSKPSGGIPSTDLASAVQTSLGKADTALQSYTETDPTVPSWAKASSKPSYTASEVGAAPTSHASSATTYGIGTSSNYGHLKLSASTSSTDGESNGVAATPSAVKAAYDLANGKITAPSSPSSGNVLTYNGSSWVASAPSGGLPDQTGNSGKYLTTNGTAASWEGFRPIITLTSDYVPIGSSYNHKIIKASINRTAIDILEGFSVGDEFWIIHDNDYYTDIYPENGSVYINGGTGSAAVVDLYQRYSIAYFKLVKIESGTEYWNATVSSASESYIPPQSGNSGKYLTTNGSVTSWAAVETLPDQTGNSGKYLTTNGTAASWGSASATSTKSIDTAPTSSSSNLITSGGVFTAINNKVNRTTAVNAADTNYTTLMARGMVMLDGTTYDAVSDWSTYLVNGAIAWRYE